MKELLTLTGVDVRSKMQRIEPREPYSATVAKELAKTCIGQDEAMDTIARRITLADASMNDVNRPLGVMLFAGKTGTGKTESARAVSKYWFGEKASDHLKIIDCTEYQQPHMITRLTGAPPSYIGYGDEPVITPAFLATKNIIVLDEFEKADPDFHKAWLQVFEEARMNTQNGQPLDFANSLIILTSNAGAAEMQKVGTGNQLIGFGKADNEAMSLDGVAKKALKERFNMMPELLGRIDDIVVFKDLGSEQYSAIFDKFLREKNESMFERLEKDAPFFATTQEYKDFVLSSFDTTYGARDLRKALDRELFHKVADLFMGQDLTGKPIVADREDDETYFYTDELDEWCDDEKERLSPETNPLREGLPDEGNIIEFPIDRSLLQQ